MYIIRNTSMAKRIPKLSTSFTVGEKMCCVANGVVPFAILMPIFRETHFPSFVQYFIEKGINALFPITRPPLRLHYDKSNKKNSNEYIWDCLRVFS